MASAAINSVTPFLTIWLWPRATIRRIVASDPKRHVLLLAGTCYALAALTTQRSLEAVPSWNLPPRKYFTSGLFVQWLVALYNPTGVWPSREAEIATFVVLGAPVGIVWLYVCGAIVKWTGRLFGGTATAVDVRAAIAWAQVPFIVAPVFSILASPSSSSAPCTNCDVGSLFVFGVFGYAGLVIWTFVLLVKCVAQVHRVSAWRGLGAVTLWLWSIPFALHAILIVAQWLTAGVHPVS